MVVSVKAKSIRKMRLDRMAICFERLAANQPEPRQRPYLAPRPFKLYAPTVADRARPEE